MKSYGPTYRHSTFRVSFVEGLGWDHYVMAEPFVVRVDGYEYALKPVAKKAEFAVFECAPGSDDAIPDYPFRGAR